MKLEDCKKIDVGMEIFLYSGCTSIAYIYAMTIFKISVSICCAVEKKYESFFFVENKEEGWWSWFKGLLHFDKPMLVLMLVKQAFSLTQIPDILPKC